MQGGCSSHLRLQDKPEELVLIELQSTAYMEAKPVRKELDASHAPAVRLPCACKDGSKVTGQELGTLQLKGGGSGRLLKVRHSKTLSYSTTFS